jgi:hypothetical protein
VAKGVHQLRRAPNIDPSVGLDTSRQPTRSLIGLFSEIYLARNGRTDQGILECREILRERRWIEYMKRPSQGIGDIGQ